MLGYYNYTVVLTYVSLLSAGLGIVVSLQGDGHPYIGTFFLLFCGLCDAFDGKIARMKKDRTVEECKFGIQIDSLCDLVSFGVLPACIGEAMIWHSTIASVPTIKGENRTNDFVIPVLCFVILMLYILAAMIRLAYFNVTEEVRQQEEGGARKYFEGLPVTSAALVFPSIMLLQFLTTPDITAIYLFFMLIVGTLFISRIKVKKPDFKGILYLIGVGVVECIILIIWMIVK